MLKFKFKRLTYAGREGYIQVTVFDGPDADHLVNCGFLMMSKEGARALNRITPATGDVVLREGSLHLRDEEVRAGR